MTAQSVLCRDDLLSYNHTATLSGNLRFVRTASSCGKDEEAMYEKSYEWVYPPCLASGRL
jgi:hypothetical protein